MTRIVRLEEIDGDLVLRVPADMAARLNLVAGEDVAMSDIESSLKVEQIDADTQRQLALVMEIIDENDEALTILAK